MDSYGRTVWIADAHRDDGKRFVVGADEKLTAFLELESVIRPGGELSLTSSQAFSKLGAEATPLHLWDSLTFVF